MCCGNWTADGKYFVFATGRLGGSDVNIWALRENSAWYRRNDRGPFQLTTAAAATTWPLPSANGKRLFVDSHQERNEFLRYDLKSGRTTNELSGISGTNLEYSKDGKWIVWVSVPDGSLWRSAADGSQRLQLTRLPMQADMPHWSPDGKRIAFFGRKDAEVGRVFVVSANGGALKRVTHGECGDGGDRDATWSPDGESLAFGCGPRVPESVARVRVVNLKTGQVAVLAGSEGIWSPRWSPDGRFIAGLREADFRLVLYELRTQKATVLSEMPSGYPSWSRDEEYLYYDTISEEEAWWRMRMRDRKTERIAPFKDMKLVEWFGPGAGDSLVAARTVGADEIYALDWEAP
jgi:Tol biopolymer transport system component